MWWRKKDGGNQGSIKKGGRMNIVYGDFNHPSSPILWILVDYLDLRGTPRVPCVNLERWSSLTWSTVIVKLQYYLSRHYPRDPWISSVVVELDVVIPLYQGKSKVYLVRSTGSTVYTAHKMKEWPIDILKCKGIQKREMSGWSPLSRLPHWDIMKLPHWVTPGSVKMAYCGLSL